MADADRWWALIEASRAPDRKTHAIELARELSKLTVADIVAFDTFAQQRMADAYRWDLWAVAYIMNGGSSDDGFDYFCGWLVMKGKQHYEAALANPADAAKGVSPDDEPFENDTLFSVPSRAWGAVTGKPSDDYFDGIAPQIARELTGEPIDEDTVCDRYPELAEKFDS